MKFLARVVFSRLSNFHETAVAIDQPCRKERRRRKKETYQRHRFDSTSNLSRRSYTSFWEPLATVTDRREQVVRKLTSRERTEIRSVDSHLFSLYRRARSRGCNNAKSDDSSFFIFGQRRRVFAGYRHVSVRRPFRVTYIRPSIHADRGRASANIAYETQNEAKWLATVKGDEELAELLQATR